ncbi:MAG: hypothetical protein FWC57_05805 [Endomicrobia bacterium]|nr:hypothetical protein [Endomicrobiia bacterium]
MKRFLVVSAMLFAVSVAAFAQAQDDQEFIVKLGIQPQGVMTLAGSDQNTNVGISAGFEYFKYFGNIFAAGAGAVYDLPREFKNNDQANGNVSFLPVYVGAKLRTPLYGLADNYAFLTGRLGYSAFMNGSTNWIQSSSGGLYYAGGIGVSISYLVIEAIYAINNLSYTAKNTNKSYDEKYSVISLYVGFKFE